jgi:hypothetical protein
MFLKNRLMILGYMRAIVCLSTDHAYVVIIRSIREFVHWFRRFAVGAET